MRQNICPVHLVFKLVKIKIDVAANTARLTTTHRQIVEQLNVRLYQLKLAGVHHEIPHQYLQPSGAEPTRHLPSIYVWLCVIDCVYRRKSVHLSYPLGSFLNYDIFSMRPFRLNYDLPPNLNFADVGRLLLLRYQMIHFEVLLLNIVNLKASETKSWLHAERSGLEPTRQLSGSYKS